MADSVEETVMGVEMVGGGLEVKDSVKLFEGRVE